MKSILVIHLGFGEASGLVEFQGHQIEIKRLGCGRDAALARLWIAEQDGKVDVLGLAGLPA